ncbi:MAG TPA: hypothetical protein VK140_08045 [Ktedonobacteraceae bacterium]|nr:hypothetical protein [Ktedonobacteraceae bacterium]
MASYRLSQSFQPRLWIAVAATGIAFVVALLASLNLYLLEDSNPLTQAAYSASPVLRFSYDGVYLSALVAALAVCAIIGYAITRASTPVFAGLMIVTLIVILGGFGGLLVRYPVNFLAFLLAFVALTLVSLLVGRAIATRSTRRLGERGERAAAIVGACASAGMALLVNVVALVTHTLLLNPVSHALFMQGQIGETHFSSLLIAMGLELLTMLIYALSIGFALRSPSRSS